MTLHIPEWLLYAAGFIFGSIGVTFAVIGAVATFFMLTRPPR